MMGNDMKRHQMKTFKLSTGARTYITEVGIIRYIAYYQASFDTLHITRAGQTEIFGRPLAPPDFKGAKLGICPKSSLLIFLGGQATQNYYLNRFWRGDRNLCTFNVCSRQKKNSLCKWRVCPKLFLRYFNNAHRSKTNLQFILLISGVSPKFFYLFFY